MSENPTPEMPPPSPTPQPPLYDTSAVASEVVVVSATTTVQKRSPLHPTGTIITGLGLIAGLVPLGVFIFGGAIKLETLDAVQSLATNGTILVLASVGLGLIATIVNLLRPSSTGKGASLIVSLVTLVGMAAFLLTTVLPRDSNLQNLNNNIAPFGYSIRDNCQTPLNNETAHYNQVVKDSPAISTTASTALILSELGSFATAMQTDTKTFQTDATNLQGNLTNLQNLKVPDSKYQALHDGCVKDVTNTIAFLNATTNQQIPTAQFVTAFVGVVSALPASQLPTAAKPGVIALIKANVPATYNAITLLQTAQGLAACGANPLGTCPVQLTGIAAVPLADRPTVFAIFGVGYSTFVNQAFSQAAAQTDATLTAEGNQLKADIKAILRDNLAPINVDVNAIVDN